MRRQSCPRWIRRHIPMATRNRTKSKTLLRAASVCRLDGSSPDDRRAGQRLFSCCLCSNVALIGARSEVVRFFPQTASLFAAVGLPVNLRNLKFENMRISKEAQEGLASLV